MPFLSAGFVLLPLLGGGPASHVAIEGTYEMRQADMSGTLVITQSEATHVRIDLELVNQKTSRLGVLEGQVLELRNGIAVYQSNSFGPCKVTLWFLGDSVRVEEDPGQQQCGFGVGITASGSYLKAGLFQFNDEVAELDILELEELRRVSADFAVADDALGKAVKAFRKGLSHSSRKAFTDEQADWIQERARSALLAGPKGSGPYVDELIKLTRERTDILTRGLAGRGG
jgi:hypothetical protein